ncbi:MAG TPA: glutathione S-transferase family protein [Candidatus Polarisedimenticolaceae bacterium]|nr:glutathione S-transferase family protein [Candidatus Polarisedimenticolaceae bacterium]
MIRLYRFAFSTNVERVALAIAHKGLPCESVPIDPDDRGVVRAVSGQDLVPVIVDRAHGDKVVVDSMAIVRYLEETYPGAPLYPKDPARRAEMDVFIEWFNRVWKRPPNLIFDELQRSDPDPVKMDAWGAEMAGWLVLFENMLAGRDYLMGDAFQAADCCAFPFLKYALLHDPADTHLFHRILIERMPLEGRYPSLTRWIRRVDLRPRA